MELPPTKNAARTSAHLAKIAQRRINLRREIETKIPPSKATVLEIGCGHGHFLTAYATAHPNSTCIGIDIASERIGRAERKRVRAKLDKLHFIHTDAQLFIEELPTDFSLAEIYVLFPDPWPKQRHHKNRLIQPRFLDQLARRAGQGARLFFRTDYEPYFAEAETVFRENKNWGLLNEPWPFEHQTVFQERAAAFQSLVARVKTDPPPAS